MQFSLPIMLFPAITFVVSVAVLVSLKRGAVFLPTNAAAVKTMVEMLKIQSGERAVDLGSGDGRIVVALARAGAEAHGYEHNPFLVWWSRRKIRNCGLSDRAFIHQANFWNTDLSGFSVVTVFGINYVMRALEEKLQKEGQAETRIASYTFSFPTLKPILRKNGIYFYKI